jgi:aerobic-type carbon monoxide dehydrogenase small subunit (CoxS/CutS family)
MATFKLNVNGASHSIEAVPDMPLLWALRDMVGLTGTKYGCGIGACGACTVLVDGTAKRSCQIPLSELGDKKVITIEGLSKDASHPLQEAWIEHDVPQCGYCQTGQIMAAAGLLAKKPHPTDADIDDAFASHICRCGTYGRIREAIHAASGKGGGK